MDYIKAELLAPGEISFTSDPQLGKAVITADSWEEMCDNAAEYFRLRTPAVMGAPGLKKRSKHFKSIQFNSKHLKNLLKVI